MLVAAALIRPESGMAHEIAKLILEHAGTFLERKEAVRTALSLGMPLSKIEEYLDWIDHHRPVTGDRALRDDPSTDAGQR